MEETSRFALPLLVAGQAQKEVFHNEAIAMIDMLISPVVEDGSWSSPPTNPVVGRCYRVGANPLAAFAGREGHLAAYGEGGWRFIIPVEAMKMVERQSGLNLAYRAGMWEAGIERAAEIRVGGQTVVRARQPAISAISGGTMVDQECRAAVASILSAMRAHGLIES